MRSKINRNRLISRSIIIFVTMFIVVSLLVCCGNGQACTYITYTVCPGDSLTSLHSRFGQAMKYHDWATKMYKINNIDVGEGWLYEGEKILVLEAVK
jgi:hypothetical protein